MVTVTPLTFLPWHWSRCTSPGSNLHQWEPDNHDDDDGYDNADGDDDDHGDDDGDDGDGEDDNEEEDGDAGTDNGLAVEYTTPLGID